MSKKKIIHMYNDSVPPNDIAKYFNITMRELLDLLEENVKGFHYKGAPRLSQKRKKEILIQYVDHEKSTNNISKELGHDKKTVSKIIKENNIYLRTAPLENHINEILKMAKEGFHATQIAKMYNVNASSIIRRLKPHGITFQPYKPTPQSQDSARRHHFNKNFFKELDWEGPVYVLFLFATDGVFLKDSDNLKVKGIEIGQKRDSEDLLLRVLQLMESDGKLRDASYNYTYTSKITKKTTTGTRYSKIASFSSIEMAEDVRDHLQLPSDRRFYKSLELVCPNNVPHYLENHACRAAFDGDGHLNYHPNANNNKKEKDMFISFYGTAKFLEGIRDMVYRNCDVSFVQIKPKEKKEEQVIKESKNGSDTASLYEVSWSGRRQVLTIMDWMYKGATIYLEEKYQKYKSIDRKKRIVDLDSFIDGPSLNVKRKELGLSQAALARLISCSASVISDFERGIRTTMTSEKAKKFIDYFNIEVDKSFFYY